MAAPQGREPGAAGAAGAARARGGPSLTTWCKVRAGRTATKPRHHHDSPREARRSLNAILKTSRRLGVRADDLGRLAGVQVLLQEASTSPRTSARASPSRRPQSLAHDPDFLAAGILFALMIAVLAGVVAAMLVADSERASDLPGNKSTGGGALREAMLRARSAADGGLAFAEDTAAVEESLLSSEDANSHDDDDDDDDVPGYLLELLQTHRNQQHLEEDFILGYHDDYRERYDGFDQPPPFRRLKGKASAPAAPAVPASDLEISEEEAFSTRVFVTTPRRQR